MLAMKLRMSTSYKKAAWDISTASYVQSFSVSAQENLPLGLFFKPDGTKMYMVGSFGDDVNEYDLSSAWDISTASYLQNFSVSAQESFPEGLFFKPDGTKMYVVGYSTDSVYQYSLSAAFDISTAVYDNVSFGVDSQDTAPRDISFSNDGNKMFILGDATNAIYQYSTA